MTFDIFCQQSTTVKMSERFSLKWNDFHSNVSKSFRLLRGEDYLQDVTLVTDDNKQMSAHKLVLSACSEYFKGVFKNNKNLANPILCLNGIDYEDLKNILDYMYNGEVHIFQENLDRLLEVAQRFRLEGLMESNTEKEEHQNAFYSADMKASYSSSSFVKPHVTSRVKETFDETRQEGTTEIESVEKISSISTNIQELEEQINQYLEKCSDGLFRCTLSGKTANRSNNVRMHIETHIEGLEFPCDKCDKTFRSRNVLSSHNVKVHKK